MRLTQDPPKGVHKGTNDNFEVQPDVTPRREGGDSLSETSPTDSRADEKVLVNGQGDQVVNASQTSAINGETE